MQVKSPQILEKERKEANGTEISGAHLILSEVSCAGQIHKIMYFVWLSVNWLPGARRVLNQPKRGGGRKEKVWFIG